MATNIILPKIGFSMEEGQIAEWFVENGTTVTEGEPLFSLESDKSVNEVEAPASGVLTILMDIGKMLPVGTILGTIA